MLKIDSLKVGNYLMPIDFSGKTIVKPSYSIDVLKVGIKYEILSVSYYDDLSVLVRLKTECGDYGIHLYVSRLQDYFKIIGIKEKRLEKLQSLLQ